MWEELVSIENLFNAYKKASKGRRSRLDVATFDFDLEGNIFSLRDELVNGTYQHGSYHSFSIHDPKRRLISAANFKDRIVHHALVSILEPEYEKIFLPNSFANRIGKGTHKALKTCSSMMRRFEYYLFMDVTRFFPSIDHQKLIELLVEVVNDEKTLQLCTTILKSGEKVLESEYDMVWIPGYDLFAINRRRGLPIGNMTSQFWANVYLNPLDHLLKTEIISQAWLRYVDDIVVFSTSKKDLNCVREKTIDFLSDLRMTIHEGSAQPTPTSQGLTFLGFRLFPDYIRLKRKKLVNGYRKLKGSYQRLRENRCTQDHYTNQLKGWLSHVRQGNTWQLRRTVLQKLGISATQGE